MEYKGQLTPSQTTDLLRQLGHSPVKKFGQNFLVDSNIVRKSLELADVSEGDIVVEVGPGLGTLTGALLERGAKVYAVEIDKRLFAFLKKRFEGVENLNLINDDAVEYPLAALPDDVENFKIVANLPYAISTPWLDKVLSGKLPQKMSLMLQKEAALRFSARNNSGEFSPISVFLSEAYNVLPPHKVSAGCFHPRPAVDSMLLALEKKENAYTFAQRTRDIMRAVFSKRRKQISSIARSAGADAEILTKWLELSPDLPPDRRPEAIENRFWVKLDEVVRQ
ncbi:MAG: ribosomal RNA small subunit methyltransferase A [Opitutales bacterium]|nr:ribosomal RNA small subunit methyltransferase A [Opitutales bacterium]MBR7106070.1 ribosomal RNA small subunit methyltransferase A [Opitutales bacterium]